MKQRDEIAFAAMQGILANPSFPHTDTAAIAKWSYDLADAMHNESKKLKQRPVVAGLDLDLPPVEKEPRKRNLPMDALVEVCKLDAKAIGSMEGKALREIKAMCNGDSDEEIAKKIRIRANVYASKFQGCALTVSALAKHWSGLTMESIGIR